MSQIKHRYNAELSSVLFQHEIDHLNGEIHTDKAKLVLDRDDFYKLKEQYLANLGDPKQERSDRFTIGSEIYKLAKQFKSLNVENKLTCQRY